MNTSGPAAPIGAADAHESLGKVLRYTGTSRSARLDTVISLALVGKRRRMA